MQHGDRDAVVAYAQGRRLSYEALDRHSDAVARGLREVGVRKGERVAVSLGNNIEFAVVCCA
jgi:non-ribosomal peptide synthetase component E (peptide arylation enzyme)